MTLCSSIFSKLIIERTHEITYGNQTIHFQRTSKYDNRATQKLFSRSSEETKLLRENDKSGNGIGPRVETSHKDGMVFDASEQRRNNNSSASGGLSRISESNITYEQTDEFRRIQEECRRLLKEFEHSETTYRELDADLQKRYTRSIQQALESGRNSNSCDFRLLGSSKGSSFNIGGT